MMLVKTPLSLQRIKMHFIKTNKYKVMTFTGKNGNKCLLYYIFLACRHYNAAKTQFLLLVSQKNLDHRSWHCSDYNDSKLMVRL